jgi:hypothetical protein
MKRGRAARVDDEDERNGTANRFRLFAPREGWRHVEVTDRRTAIDYARVQSRKAPAVAPRSSQGQALDPAFARVTDNSLNLPKPF